MFFSFFFRSFSDQCYRDSLYPAPWVLKPASPPHNPHPRASPLKPPKSPPPPLPHRTQAWPPPSAPHASPPPPPPRHCAQDPPMTPTRHAQALLWRHLNTERKTPTPPTRRAQVLPWRHPNTECKAPPPPTSRDANTVRRTPPPRRNANTLHRTPPPHHPQHGVQNGAAVGTVAVVDSGMAAAGMATTARHSYYLRLYIFYMCNKLILFCIL